VLGRKARRRGRATLDARERRSIRSRPSASGIDHRPPERCDRQRGDDRDDDRDQGQWNGLAAIVRPSRVLRCAHR
jgi:hypothetical protein